MTINGWIDLRSDTVTLPTPEMRKAMAQAEVGDDVYGEDATINRLQEMAAERMGKQAGLFVASGTMGNLVAVLAHCGRGDEVIMGHLAHTFLFEGGGVAALGGVMPQTIQNQPDGTLVLEEIRSAIKSDDAHFPISRLLVLENTHNRCGGVPLSVEYTQQAASVARNAGLKVHLDGARIFNAAVALKTDVRSLSAPVDSVTFCLSKGLCAPVGSVLCGTTEFIKRAHRMRKQVGGGMRQAGILAAAGIISLERMIDRLVEDHDRARLLAEKLSAIPGLDLDRGISATNMVFASLNNKVKFSAVEVANRLGVHNVRVGVVAERKFRMVTHYWVSDLDVENVAIAFKKVLS